MTYLGLVRSESGARVPRSTRQSFPADSDIAISNEAANTVQEHTDIFCIEQMVREGRQAELADYFKDRPNPPSRIGDWDIRVNVRRVDGEDSSRTVVALPLNVRARMIFEEGCLSTLKRNGYTEEEAQWYYKAAWKKKYVWIPQVITAVKEMTDTYNTVAPLENYEASGDPRRLASQVSVPKNPYLTSHAHFLVAVEMAKSVVRARIRATARA